MIEIHCEKEISLHIYYQTLTKIKFHKYIIKRISYWVNGSGDGDDDRGGDGGSVNAAIAVATTYSNNRGIRFAN